jgi:nucleoside-diphosphate-sugar epimerase
MSRHLAVVAGGGGFIGGHLVASLLGQGYAARAVDVKPLAEWYQVHRGADNVVSDLRLIENCERACAGAERVFQLVADMGGNGIHRAQQGALYALRPDQHAHAAGREASGGSPLLLLLIRVRLQRRQTANENVVALKEEDAYPAMPEDGYGWGKLFSERMCRHFREDFGLTTRVARYHKVHGPYGTWEGGREKAPAAICRKVIQAKLSGHHAINVWGNGHQTRSFMYIDDCIKGTEAIIDSDILEPIYLGSSELVTVNQLVDLVEEIAGITLKRSYDSSAPKGVNGRNSDNSRIQEQLGWEPGTRLHDGLEKTYRWIYDEYVAKHAS